MLRLERTQAVHSFETLSDAVTSPLDHKIEQDSVVSNSVDSVDLAVCQSRAMAGYDGGLAAMFFA